MERLNAAIEQARRRRNAVPEPDAVVAPHRGDSDLRWQALREFEPDPRQLSRNRIFANVRGKPKNSIDMLRTRLIKLMQEKGWKRVMITSPTPGCGKTTLVANLAQALQRQPDLRAIAMDLDMPRSNLGRLLGLSPSHGVEEYLSGKVDAQDHLYRIGANLAVSVSGNKSGDSSELIKASLTQKRIDALDKEYAPDVMLFDFPPYFATDDTIAAARFVDCAIIVGAAEQTSVAEIDATERDLSQYTNVAGVVLNKCRIGTDKYGYDYSGS